MEADEPASPSGIRPASQDRVWVLVGGGSALALLFLGHPYWGITYDADLYIGRALADADPAGLGRDIIFAHDGQSGFSLFPPVIAAWIGVLGPSTGALTLTVLALVAWFTGMAGLAATLARGRVLWASLVAGAVVPGFYGGLFRYAEQFATARPFAEAASLAGLAALATGRAGLSLAVLLGAAAIHPIMAAPALLVWCLVQIAADRRWLLLPVVTAATILAAASAGLPLAARLFTVMDAEWLSAVSANAYLFPSRWRETIWAPAAVRPATVLLALPFLSAAQRRVPTGILVASLIGLGVTYLAADRFVLVLVVQAQPWRALWLLSLAGTLTLPIAAVGLWRSGRQGQLALACLTLGWVLAPTSALGAAAAGAALLVPRLPIGLTGGAGKTLVRIAWVTVCAAAALTLGQRWALVLELWTAKPADASILGHVWLFWVLSAPLVLIGILVALNTHWRLHPVPSVILTTGLIVLAIATWDDRSRLDRITDKRMRDPALSALLPPGPAEVLWLRDGARYAWALAGQPNWVSHLQGASIVFSADLARIWQGRMERLLAAGLADTADRSPWIGERQVLHPTLAQIRAFCEAPDAPVAIIAPLDGSVMLPAGVEGGTYRLPAPLYELADRGGGFGWQRTDEVAIVPCRAHRQP
ncbi:hypothetical protein [Enterovirga aerilata]|uniref:Uncharacterized protein n=1 Tax=Enterovirga aerilata TaxID=2730920 RepID=A0A849ICB6_9HYPH|nr:hypothetical protein [Enterovirga sp. DB1703]NNM73680.1 hypothetical protein [Enterovirga sp. DB1703]